MDDVDAVLERVVAHGGTITMPKAVIPTVGALVRFLDTEGNDVGAMKYEVEPHTQELNCTNSGARVVHAGKTKSRERSRFSARGSFTICIDSPTAGPTLPRGAPRPDFPYLSSIAVCSAVRARK